MVVSSYSSTMAPNISDKETKKLAEEVAKTTGESKRPPDMHKWLETEIWPQIPEEELDKPPLSKAEIEEILGYGPDGV